MVNDLIAEDSYLGTICLVSDIRARLCWAVGISINVIICSLLHEQTQLNHCYDDENNAKNNKEQTILSLFIRNAFVII